MPDRATYAAAPRGRVLEATKKHWSQYKSDCSGFAKAVAKDLGISLSGQANDICRQIQAPPWVSTGVGETAASLAAKKAAEGDYLVLACTEATGHGHVAIVVGFNESHRVMASWGSLGSVGKEYESITWSWRKDELKNVRYAYREIPCANMSSRKDAITRHLEGCNFVVNENSRASSKEPLYELQAFSAVDRNGAHIDRVAREKGVDARLLRAIMYVETTHGYYDIALSMFGRNKSLLPMNINVDYWGDVFGTRQALLEPSKNVEAGATMLSRIIANLPPSPSVAKIVTLYNNINATTVSDYGSRVAKVYDEQPWKKR